MCFARWCGSRFSTIMSVAYIPNGRVLGLSKIARIADMVAKRLQLQERIGSDIAYVISKAAGTEDVAVMIEAHHSCMTARGIKKPGSKTQPIHRESDITPCGQISYGYKCQRKADR